MNHQWDNIEILQAIDREQLQHGGTPLLESGYGLMQKMTGTFAPDPALWAGLVQELHIARDAGLLTFDPPRGAGMSVPADPSDPNMYLQAIRGFALTVAGQDRARGRLVVQDPPDPHDDDGRLISSLTLGRVATAISTEYEPQQARAFLAEAGAPPTTLRLPAHVDPADASQVLNYLAHDTGSEGRRALRVFLGAWLDDRLPTGPDDELRASLIEQFARQGWYVRNGVLVIGERAAGARTASPVLRDARLASLHPQVRTAAEPYVRSGHPATAVFEVVKAVNKRVKQMAGKSAEPDNASLMGTVFSLKQPLLQLADPASPTGRDIQEGYMHLFTGLLKAFRNPGAHEPSGPLSADEAFEILGFASLLMRCLDSAAAPGGS